jgi:hypothetical protein
MENPDRHRNAPRAQPVIAVVGRPDFWLEFALLYMVGWPRRLT